MAKSRKFLKLSEHEGPPKITDIGMALDIIEEDSEEHSSEEGMAGMIKLTARE